MTLHAIDSPFWIGDVVHHRLADDDTPGIITSVRISPEGTLFCVTWRGRAETWSYALELQREKPDPIPSRTEGEVA